MNNHTTKRGRRTQRQRRTALAGVLCLALAAVALASSLAAQNAPQAAGSITALIPKDFIQRGRSAPIEAKKGAAVQWEDVIRTEQGGRVRLTLTDGSVLNIGSQAQLKILQQDAASEQSQLELIYGKVRADVVKRTRPDGEFTVRTPTAVAGVIGTGEYLEATPTETVVIALNGIVAVSSNNPTIPGSVFLKPGKKTRVLQNQPPGPPEDATEEDLDNAYAQTSSLPRASLQPASAQPGASLAAVLSGIDLTGITGLSFSHDGLSATLGASSEQGLGVNVNVAEDVPPGRYTFTVWAGGETVGEGRFLVVAPGEGSSRALDVHLPPDAVITGEWYFDPQQPPLPLLTGRLEVAQGALLRLSGTESTSSDGHPITEFDWDVPGTSIRGSGPTFELDTWQLQAGSRRVRLRVFDDDRHSARVELDLEVRGLPNSDELIPNCLVGGYEAQDVNQFMSCFSVDFRAYPVLFESIQTFLQDASEVRVYSRIDNRQILRDDANYQVTFDVAFSTDAAPTLIQTRTEQLTLRMHLYRETDSEQWLITDFSSQVVATGSGTGSQGFSPDFAILLDPTGATLTAGAPPVTINVTVQPLGGFTESVQLSVDGLPPDVDVSASFGSSTVPAGTSTSLTFTPGFVVPTDSFDIKVIGRRNNLERTALLQMQVQAAPNNPPVANGDSAITDEDGTVGITLTGSDPDGDPLTFTVASNPANGALAGLAPNLTYTPAANFNGSDSFTFTVS
ncbi:MAG: hypothetical protein A3B65_07730, partial [Acidobacteria bacterium RIFCSPHIGHO2_02_FULL_67_57]